MGYRTLVRKPVLQGTTPQITFQIVDEVGVGFQPDVLTMSIYDKTCPTGGTTVTSAIINSRNDIDVLASCDVSGNVDLTLEEDDTALTTAANCSPATIQRTVLFRWEWDSTKVGKHELVLTIAPDRETVAT